MTSLTLVVAVQDYQVERKHERRIGPFFFELQNLPAQPSTKNGAALRYIELRIKLIELCLRCLALKPTELWGVTATCSGKQLAFEAIRTANLTNIEEPQTIKRQKKDAKDGAITK